MNSRERVLAALAHRTPDRTPCFEYVLLAPVADEILGRPTFDYAGDCDWLAYAREIGWESALKQYVVDRLDAAEILGHDLVYLRPCPVIAKDVNPHLKAGGGAVGAPDGRDDDDPVARLERRVEKSAAAGFVWPEDSFHVYALMREEMDRRGLDLPVMAPCYFHGVWTDVDLMQTMLLDPDVARRHFVNATRWAETRVAKYIDYGVDIVGVGGDFSGNRPLISPESYRAFIMPEVRKVSDLLHAAGRFAVNASDGDLWPVIDDFLVGSGVDGYLEIDSRAGMELRRLKASHGARITFFGNMDCGTVLSTATPEEIRRETFECLEAGSGNGGHVFCASNAITASVPLENYLAMVGAYRAFFGLDPVRIPLSLSNAEEPT